MSPSWVLRCKITYDGRMLSDIAVPIWLTDGAQTNAEVFTMAIIIELNAHSHTPRQLGPGALKLKHDHPICHH